MIKHKWLVVAIIIGTTFGILAFAFFAVNSSYKEELADSSSQDLYPDTDDVEFIDDSEGEPMKEDPQEAPAAPSPSPQEQTSNSPDQDALLQKLGLESIDQEYKYYIAASPNDPYYPQWYLSNLQAENAWDIGTGKSTTTVAVIDTGFALQHEDLVDRWATNSGESGQTQNGDPCWTGSPEDKNTNNCDDDSNGYIDDWRGWDFHYIDNDVQAGQSGAGHNHGTKVSGLVGSTGNNGTGVVALNWNTKILPLAALSDDGFGFTSRIVEAVVYAVDQGVDVINMSLSGPYQDSAMIAAVDYAERYNVTIVAAAGNCADDPNDSCSYYTNTPGRMGYPARYDDVIAVGASTSSDSWASFSSYGPEMDVIAPGSGTIQTTTWTSSNGTSAYATSSYGTSFASPIVASLVGLIKAELPSTSTAEVIEILRNNTDKVSGMGGANWTEKFGFGRVNAYKTMQEVNSRITKLSKVGGLVPLSDGKPIVASSKGHTASNKVGGSNVKTWCVAATNSVCTVTFKRQGSSITVSLPARRTNTQGFAEWAWNNSDIGSGTWDVTAQANGITSSKEVIYIQ